MSKGIFVTGTDTGVGKTVVSALIAESLTLRGLDVGVMKPFETGCPVQDGTLIPSDGMFLRRVAGADDSMEEIVPYRFTSPLAPMVAADLEERHIDLSLVMSAFSRLSRRHDILVVEGAGGLFVPIMRRPAADLAEPDSTRPYFMCDLISDMGLPVVIVTRPALGTINHTLLTIRQARQGGLSLLGLVVSHAEPPSGSLAELTNHSALEELAGCPLLATVPFIERVSEEGIRSAARSSATRLAISILQAFS